jgi:hypothetical protein
MGIVRLNPEEVLVVDGRDYDVLDRAVDHVLDVEGAIVEIGTRLGGSVKLIIDRLLDHNAVRDRLIIAIDPYGDIAYPSTNKSVACQEVIGRQYEIVGDPMSTEVVIPDVHHDYTNDMRNYFLPSLYHYAFQAGVNFQFLQLTDTEYMKRFPDGFPTYVNGVERIVDRYSLTFLDGPHTTDAVMKEAVFFGSRTSVGGYLVFDDPWMYDHEKVDGVVREFGFELIEMPQLIGTIHKSKASYRRASLKRKRS